MNEIIYKDITLLERKPTIEGNEKLPVSENEYITPEQIVDGLAQVAKTGSYEDLNNKPTIPGRLSDLADDSRHRTVTDDEKASWSSKSTFNGDYNNLTNKPDLSQFITKSVDDLTNYYLKSETYTKAEVLGLIEAIQQFHYEVYASLSDVTSPAGNVLYLIGPTGSGADKYDEYVYDSTKNPSWIKIGDTSVDLSGYVTTTALNTALANYTTTTDLATLLAAKQDTISDLGTIRSGAAAGATAYQKPSGGIPSSDMASAVQTSLGKADSAYQKPGTGIPAEDIASGVIPTALSELSDDTTHRVVTDTEITTWSGKQDAIADLSDIRSGAAAGATAYQKPSGGIPKTDLASGVQDSLDLADSAIQPTPQTLTDAQKKQARDNIYAAENPDREYDSQDPNGLGYLVLEKDKTFAEQVTAANTIYEIRYDFALEDDFTMPSGCVLKFNGGSLIDGTITGNNTKIEATDVKIFDNITFSGYFVDDLNACWVGAVPNTNQVDNSLVIQAWFSGYANTFKTLYFPYATSYYFLTATSLTSDIRDLTLDGGNSLFKVNIATDDATFITLQNSNSSLSSGEQFHLQNAKIQNIKQTSEKNISKTRGLLMQRTQRFSIENVQFWYFDFGVTLVDCWYGGFYGLNVFYECRIGVLILGATSSEVNTIEFENVDFRGAARATVAAIYPQDDGESEADYITRTAVCGVDAYCFLQGVTLRGSVIEGCDYAVRTNWRKSSTSYSTSGGPFTIDGCYFEANRQKDIYVGRGNYTFSGSGANIQRFAHIITISNCRFFTKREVYLMNATATIFGNQWFALDVDNDDYAASSVEYSGELQINTVGTSSVVRRFGGTDAILNVNGQNSTPSTNFQKLQMPRAVGNMYSRMAGYTTSGYNSSYLVEHKPWNFETEPGVRLSFDIKPLELFFDYADSAYSRLLVPSGNSMTPVKCDYGYHYRALNKYGTISLYEFMRRWNAGTSYTGTVANLFPFIVTADPAAGTVINESGTLVGFGINALGTTITTSYTTGYYLFVDALVWVHISYSRIKYYADHLQCGRVYSELRGSIDDSSANSAYLSVYGTGMSSSQKRLNNIYYQTSDSKLYIYTGFEWAEMTSPFQRYYYQAGGNKLSERATMADVPGQTFTNYATGITYTFEFRARNNYKWSAGIGKVDSLDHPNGYDDDNTLDYANELSAGEMVVYNGALYTWNGTSFVANTTSLTSGGSKIWTGTQAEYDLLTPAADTLYFIKSS